MNPSALAESVSATLAVFKKASGSFSPLLFAIVFLFAPFRLSADWVAVGPAPAINAQCEGITSAEGDNPVAGAIHAVAPSATDANVIYVAAVNGGAWRTTNAKAASPNWTPLTDQALPSLSLSSIAISPLNPQVIFVGSGRVSSLGGPSSGGKQFGIGRSTNGGTTWTVVGLNLADQDIRRVVPTTTLENGNQVVLVGSTAGVFRSADGGTTYTRVTNGISTTPTSLISSATRAFPRDSTRRATARFISATTPARPGRSRTEMDLLPSLVPAFFSPSTIVRVTMSCMRLLPSLLARSQTFIVLQTRARIGTHSAFQHLRFFPGHKAISMVQSWPTEPIRTPSGSRAIGSPTTRNSTSRRLIFRT